MIATAKTVILDDEELNLIALGETFRHGDIEIDGRSISTEQLRMLADGQDVFLFERNLCLKSRSASEACEVQLEAAAAA
jgi:hypothetical protein